MITRVQTLPARVQLQPVEMSELSTRQPGIWPLPTRTSEVTRVQTFSVWRNRNSPSNPPQGTELDRRSPCCRSVNAAFCSWISRLRRSHHGPPPPGSSNVVRIGSLPDGRRRSGHERSAVPISSWLIRHSHLSGPFAEVARAARPGRRGADAAPGVRGSRTVLRPSRTLSAAIGVSFSCVQGCAGPGTGDLGIPTTSHGSPSGRLSPHLHAIVPPHVAFPCSRDPPCARRSGAELLVRRTTQGLGRRAQHGVIPGLAAPASGDRLRTAASLVRSGTRSAPYVWRHLRRGSSGQPKLLRPAQQVLDG